METLKTSGEFERVRRAGRTWASGPVLLNAAPNELGTIRCGFIAGKKIGNAVKRNRARRLIREAVRLCLPRLKPGWDLVWIARASIGEADFTAVQEAVVAAMQRAKLFAPSDPVTGDEFSRIM
jgi:ribonuclease P protein component